MRNWYCSDSIKKMVSYRRTFSIHLVIGAIQWRSANISPPNYKNLLALKGREIELDQKKQLSKKFTVRYT
jgi:hypothetical protein